MTASSGGFSSVPLIRSKLQIFSFVMLLSVLSCAAQQVQTQSAQTQNPPADETPVTIPAGTHLALSLTHPVDSRATHRGDEIFAQTTSPVIVSNQVVIPAGTFVQGKVDKLSRRGSRGELLMQSISVVFPNGYVANINGPLNIQSDEGTAWSNPSSAEKTGIFVAPFAGLGIGAAIGAAQHTTQSSTLGGTTLTSSTPKGLAIGSLVGLAAGGAVAIVLLARSHHFYVQEGSPLELSLPQPVTIAEIPSSEGEHVAAVPLQPAPKRRPLPQMPASIDHGTYYIPGSPGTPGTYIPGTPPVGNSPGTPGTYIPGTPPTPPIPYPCP
jgi:type IV secretion system protein VirB10